MLLNGDWMFLLVPHSSRTLEINGVEGKVQFSKTSMVPTVRFFGCRGIYISASMFPTFRCFGNIDVLENFTDLDVSDFLLFRMSRHSYKCLDIETKRNERSESRKHRGFGKFHHGSLFLSSSTPQKREVHQNVSLRC